MECSNVTFEQIKNSPEIQTYIKMEDQSLKALGFTEHAFAHVTRTAENAGNILKEMGYSEREQELGKIAGYIHDIGNIVNRIDHAQSGAVMAFRILDKMGMTPEEISIIISAIGNHDEGTAAPVNAIAAALILADKSDVRRTRVRNRDLASFDIHDRVNYAVTQSSLNFSDESDNIILELTIDTDISPVMSYFEIFMDRMLLCNKAAAYFHKSFGLVVNKQRLL
ncbi:MULTISPECIES: HD domain-containing protein [Clostridiaceae]|uniref:HD domain-containing protein n=1 Tax=Clostridium facile TaxID=2763035 RepID=A0ABR7IS91_9CLOT|nr:MULTISPECIES: HD domain-containing protein [Clostridiaceae]MBC5788014.1 HD domain-containing protein [Clostridium facile]PWM98659.1 MAG: HD domain-containing protein [Massilioclostridium sp.]